MLKICGNRYVADAWRVAAAGPDFMGWIFSRRSPRQIPVALAARLIAEIRWSYPRIEHVGVFAENPVTEVLHIDRECELDWLQVIDGPGFITSLESVRRTHMPVLLRPALRDRIWPVVRVRAELSDTALVAAHGGRPLYLMDSYVPGQPGGTGRRFASELVAEVRRPFLLAGGLNPENVVDALAACPGARGVDVSSGIEVPGAPGHKSPEALAAFVRAVRGA